MATLQDDLDRFCQTTAKRPSNKSIAAAVTNDTAVLAEELQKKIIENAELSSLIADRNAECQLFADRIVVLESKLTSKLAERTDNEKQMRRELDVLTTKNAMLETRLAVDTASSVIGSDDTISLSADSELLGTPRNHATAAAPLVVAASNNTTADAERMAKMEKELLQLRMKCDFIKCCDMETMLTVVTGGGKEEPSTVLLQNGAASVSPTSVISLPTTTSNSGDIVDGENCDATKETILFRYFSDKLEKLYTDKVMAESKVITYVKEVRFFV